MKNEEVQEIHLIDEYLFYCDFKGDLKTMVDVWIHCIRIELKYIGLVDINLQLRWLMLGLKKKRIISIL